MSDLIHVLPNGDRPPVAEGLPPFTSIIKEERGGAGDPNKKIAADAFPPVPTLPGMKEASEREAYRQRLVTANRVIDDSQINTAASGAITGLVVGAALVVGGVEGIVVVGFGIATWKLIKFLRGRR